MAKKVWIEGRLGYNSQRLTENGLIQAWKWIGLLEEAFGILLELTSEARTWSTQEREYRKRNGKRWNTPPLTLA